MLWASLSLWLTFDLCGKLEGGGYGPPPSYTRGTIRTDSIMGWAEKRKGGVWTCTELYLIDGGRVIVRGSGRDVTCRVLPQMPECTESERPK